MSTRLDTPAMDLTLEEDLLDDQSADLRRVLFRGEYDTAHALVRDVLTDPLFDPKSEQSLLEGGLLGYRRARELLRRLGGARRVGEDPALLMAVGEWLTLLDPTAGIFCGTHMVLCSATLLGAIDRGSASQEELEPLLRSLEDMSSVGVFMGTELAHGNDLASLETVAVYDETADSFSITTPHDGARKWMPNTGIWSVPKIAIIFARLEVDDVDRGVHAFVAVLSDEDGLRPGVEISRLPDRGDLKLDNGMTRFQQLKVPRSALLTGPADRGARLDVLPRNGGRKQALSALRQVGPGRVFLSSALAAAGRASVFVALTYSGRRMVSMPGGWMAPVIEYRSQQRALFDALAQAYAATAMAREMQRRYAAGPFDTDDEQFVMIAKATISWSMTEVIATCRERCGAQGMFSVNRIAEYVTLAQAVVTAEGDNLAVVSTLAGTVLRRTDADALAPRPTGDDGTPIDDPREPEFVVWVMAQREEYLRERAQGRLQTVLTSGGTLAEAWQSAQMTALDMIRLRGRRLALQQLTNLTSDLADAADVTAVTELARLLSLREIDEIGAWCLAEQLLVPEHLKELDAYRDDVCERLVPTVGRLLGAFALTGDWLRAPIAMDDYSAAVVRMMGNLPGHGQVGG